MTIAKLPPPPYYTVIFANQRTAGDDESYDAMAARMENLAAEIPGYLGIESVRRADGFGITISYWETQEAIASWRRNVDHIEAQRKGRDSWYKDYNVRIAKVERSYGIKS